MNPSIAYTTCCFCNSAKIEKVFAVTDYTVSHAQFEVWQCNNCTGRFTQHAPAQEDIGAYYQSADYVSHSDTRKGLVNRLYHTVRTYTLKKKLQLVKQVSGLQSGHLLDIGAGTGAFAHTMQSAGWHVTGLEPDSVARQNALTNYALQLQTPDSLYNLPAAGFDVITMWHVLEHVHDLHGYIATFKKILQPGGTLIIAVPNYTSYDAHVYRQYWAAYDVPRHLYHFSPACMQQLMELHGFSITQYKPMWFDSFYVSMLSEKYKTGKSHLAKAFFNGLASNRHAAKDARKCSSVIYIIKNKQPS